MIKNAIFFLFLVVYLPVVFLSLLAAAAPFVPTTWFPALQFLPLAAQYLVPLHLGVVLILSNKRWKTRMLALLAFLACAYMGVKEFRLNLSANPGPPKVKILSFNVRSFQYAPDKHVDDIVDLVKAHDPDIVCFQEFFNGIIKGEREKVLEQISRRLSIPYDTIFSGEGNVGGVVLSKYPIVELDELFYTGKTANYGMWVKLKTPHGELGVYNVHLASFQFNRKIPTKGNWKPFLKTVYQKAESIIPKQLEQAHTILDHARGHSVPFILAGDLNSLPHSHIVSLFSTNYEDSFIRAGSGYGATFWIRKPLGMRIDYLFASPPLRTLSHEIVSSDISDHLPIVGEFTFIESP